MSHRDYLDEDDRSWIESNCKHNLGCDCAIGKAAAIPSNRDRVQHKCCGDKGDNLCG